MLQVYTVKYGLTYFHAKFEWKLIFLNCSFNYRNCKKIKLHLLRYLGI